MFLLSLLAPAAAAIRFECPGVRTPADARAYYDTIPINEVGGDAWLELYAWFDESCVTSCSMDGYYRCEEANCVTGAGATIAWRETAYYTGGYSGEDVRTRTLTVTPPVGAGLAWTSATVTREDEDTYGGSYGSASSTTYDVAWSGQLLADAPTDGWFSAGDSSSSYSGSTWTSEYSGAGYESDGCEWRWGYYWNAEEGPEIRVFVDGSADVRVARPYYSYARRACDTEEPEHWRAYVDDVLYGNVEETTWERDGDADGDGFSETDCNDGDAAVNPCAAEVACDGLDQDCNGVDACGGDTGDTGGTTDTGDTSDTADTDTDPADTDTGAAETGEPADDDTGTPAATPGCGGEGAGGGCGGGGAAALLPLALLARRRARRG